MNKKAKSMAIEKGNVVVFGPTLNYNFQILHCGYEDEPKEIRKEYYERFVLSYLIQGEGCITQAGKSFHIKKGDMYFIKPGVISQFADKNNPYNYYYVALSGADCEEIFDRAGFSLDNPVISVNDEKIEKLMLSIYKYAINSTIGSLLKLRIALLKVFDYLYTRNKQGEIVSLNRRMKVAQYIKQYIEYNYQNSFLIEDIAKDLSYAPNYLSRIFKSCFGITIKSYVDEYRIEKACCLLRMTDMRVLEIAMSVGFEDISTFCRTFKRKHKCSPSEYRKKGL